MPRVRMKEQITGTSDGKHWPAPGGECDLTEAEAERVVRLGLAERVADEPAPTRKGSRKPRGEDAAGADSGE